MRKSQFIANFRGKEENLERFILSPIFSFSDESEEGITILHSFDTLLKDIRNKDITNTGLKEIFAIEFDSYDSSINSIIECFRKEAVKYEVDINFQKENTEDMKIEYVFISSDGNFSYMIEDLDMGDLI